MACVRGALIAASGKGKFNSRENADLDPKELLFDLVDDKSLVVHNNTLCTIGDVMAEQLKKDPHAKVCYHDKTDTADGFKFTRKNNIVFVPAGQVAITEGERRGRGR